MKNFKAVFSILFISTVFIFTGCTSKYQTNNIPKEEKLVIPSKIEDKKYYLNEESKEDFRKYVVEELNNGVDERRIKAVVDTNENTYGTSGLWHKGYEIDRKRY